MEKDDIAEEGPANHTPSTRTQSYLTHAPVLSLSVYRSGHVVDTVPAGEAPQAAPSADL